MWKERLNRNLSSGFEQLSLDPRLHGNDYRGYEVLKMITVGARRAVAPTNDVNGIPELRFG